MIRKRTAVGTVKTWHPDLGWSVLTSPDVSGEIWAHFSAIVASGYRELHEGDQVEVRFHRAQQDGYRYVADSIMTAVFNGESDTEKTS